MMWHFLVGSRKCYQETVTSAVMVNTSITKTSSLFYSTERFPAWLQGELMERDLLNIGLIRMYILMLDTFRMKQTKMYICTLEEFILVEIWIHCCTKLS